MMEMIGLTFNYLTVLEQSSSHGGHTFWKCRCICGVSKRIRSSELRSGKTKSCGCMAPKLSAMRNRTHGASHTPEYESWKAMRSRCFNPKAHAYEAYGGRGITVCERWRSFENFLADMGKRPTLAHSLDRFPDHNGNYEPENCRWATPIQQARNSRSFFRANGYVE